MEQKEYAQKVGTIEVDENESVEQYVKNIRNGNNLRTPRSFKLKNVGSEGNTTTKVTVNPIDENQTAWWDSTPHPIFLSPSAFIDERNEYFPDFPERYTSKEVVRNDYELEEGTEGFKEKLDEIHEEAIEVYKEELKTMLKEEVNVWVGLEPNNRVTARVQYK